MRKIETVSGLPKGSIAKDYGRYCWFRQNGGSEVFPKQYKRDDVLRHISHLCGETVIMSKTKGNNNDNA